TRNASPSYNNKLPNFASQIRVAFSSIAWNTGSSSPGELLIARRISAVAVFCSSDSGSSRVRARSAPDKRAFSITVSALSGEGGGELVLLVDKWLDDGTNKQEAGDREAAAQQGAAERGRVVAGVTRHRQRVFGIGQRVDDMNRALLERDATTCRPAVRRNRILPQKFDTRRLDVLAGSWMIAAVVLEPHDIGLLGVAEPLRGLGDGVEHGLDIRGRTRDDVENFADGGLIFQRFSDLARARLHLIEQPHVLDRDHRLVGEGLD